MGLEFLRRVRRTAILAGAVAALVTATYAGVRPGLGLAAGVAWSLVNLALLQTLVVAITGSRAAMRPGSSAEPGTAPAATRAIWSAFGMLLLFGAGGMLLTALPPLFMLAGFLLPLAVIVLKAASRLLLQSRAWRWVTASAWRASIAVLALIVAAWWTVPAALGTPADSAHATAGPSAPESLAAPASAANPAESLATPATAQTPPSGPADSALKREGAAVTGQAPHEASGHTHGTGAEGEGESQGPEKFANVITVIAKANPDAEWAHLLHRNEAVIFAWIVGLLLILGAFLATRKPEMIPGPLQNLVESLVEGLYGFIAGIIGDRHADRFVPFLGTLGIYIWAMNLFGLIPFMDSPTSSLNITFSLAIVVFIYVQYVGIRGLGPVGYVDHLLGQPRNATGWILAPLMLPIHLLGELAKPISLSCRLFGNIFGEDMLLVAFVSLGISCLAWSHLPIGLPLQLPFLLLALLTSTLQAMVFMVLSTIYILLMLPHDHGHEAHAHSAH